MQRLTTELRSGVARCALWCVVALVPSLIATAGWSQSLTWLGVLPRHTESRAFGVSADGSVVVGASIEHARSEDDPREPRLRITPFLWTRQTGIQQLDVGTYENHAEAVGVSADGSVVVGHALDGQWRAFRWTRSGVQNLVAGFVYDISANGSVVVGQAVDGRAFRWTRAGVEYIGDNISCAYGVSADGLVVVGGAIINGSSRSFRWTRARGLEYLNIPAGWSEAWNVSADGSVVVGYAFDGSRYYSFRWTDAEGAQTLGYFWAPGMSADGSVVVGHDAYNRTAVRWTNSTGIQDLNTVYANLLSPGSYLFVAYSISPDGRYIVGSGYNADTRREEAFLLDTGFPLPGDVDRNGCVSDTDLLRVLFEFGGRGYRNEDLNWDGVVDDLDLLVVLFNFGRGC